MTDRIERKRLSILKVLQQSRKPLGSKAITEQLVNMGMDISERTVRFHLLALDQQSLTENIGRQGRRITDKGILELSKARIFEQVGFLAAKIDQMTYRMSFDLSRLAGTVVINTSLVETRSLDEAYPLMKSVFEKGFAMGKLLTIFEPGEQVGDLIVPVNYVGIGTVCSITLNGVLVAHGIPTVSRFGGLLEIENWKASRFTAIINYDGTSLDPLEIFIKSGMTDYMGATTDGNGQIGASFREVPAASRERVVELAEQVERVGLGGFMAIGWPGQPLVEIPINEGRVGAIVIGGLNPVAILEEAGIPVYSRALSALVDYSRLFSYETLADRVAKLRQA